MFITHYLGSVIGSVDRIACRLQQGAADQSNRVINSANEVSNPVKLDHMLAKGGLGVHDPTS